jgi:hypothetical protein
MPGGILRHENGRLTVVLLTDRLPRSIGRIAGGGDVSGHYLEKEL